MMDREQMVVVEQQNNNNHHDAFIENNKIANDELTKELPADAVSDGDAEVNSIIGNKNNVQETEAANNDSSNNCSPSPPRKIARRSKEHSSRRSLCSPRMKTPTPLSMLGTPLGSASEREVNSSPASIDNPPTNGSVTNDVFGDGERSDKESGDSQSVSSSTIHCASSNGPSHNHSSTFSKRSVSLQMLLSAGILKPGEGTMSLEYHGQKFLGDLKENGMIKSQETSQEFSSPSAWALACKQIINPEKILRKSGCGWASIKYKGLKLDYYKTVWFKRLREGSIDIKHFSNGNSSPTEESDDEEVPYCVLKFGEHLENNPVLQSAQQLGAKVMIGCTRFQDIERLQPFYVKISCEALALAEFHCNVTNTESLGYISGRWDNDSNWLRMESAHPCKVLMSNSAPTDCDTERNRIALEIQKLGHDVVGWYHSHPKAPSQPSRDDITRQLDYQIVMKGASESSYIPCVGVIISPTSYSSNREDVETSGIQFFWVMPPPENRPTELGRPMHIDYETYGNGNLDTQRLLLEMNSLIQFYKTKKDLIDINDLSTSKFEKFQKSISDILPTTEMGTEFWEEVKQLFNASSSETCANSHSTGSSNGSSVPSSVPNTNSKSAAATPNSPISNSNNITPLPFLPSTPNQAGGTSPEIDHTDDEKT